MAERGQLHIVNSAAELKRRLDVFGEENFPSAREPFWMAFIVRNWRGKVLAVAMAAIAWLFLAYNPSTIQRTFVVPIEYRNVPKEMEINEFAPTETRVTLSGTEPAFRLLEPAILKIALDLSNASPGHKTIHVGQKKNLTVPANLSVYRIEHSTISLYLGRRAEPKVGSGSNPTGGGAQNAPKS